MTSKKQNYIIYDMDQNSDEWVKIRLGKFTASNALTVYKGGAALNTLITKTLAEKLSNSLPPEVRSYAMDWGHDQEELAANLYELETGNKCHKIGFVEVNSYFGVSPDRVIYNQKGKIIKAVEIKCPQDIHYLKYLISVSQFGEKGIDPAHYLQMQAQMYALGIKEIDYILYNPHFKKQLFCVTVKRNEDYINQYKNNLEESIKEIKKMEKIYEGLK